MLHPPDFTYEWTSAPYGEAWDVWVWFAPTVAVKRDELVELVDASQSAHDEDALERVVKVFADDNDLIVTEFVSGTDTHRPMGDLVAITFGRKVDRNT
jgi:hypothetical protein